MKTKSRLDLLQQAAAAAAQDVTSLDNSQLAEMLRLCSPIMLEASGELRRRHSEAEAAKRLDWEARRARMKAGAEAAERARIKADAEEEADRQERQAIRDAEELEARAAMLRNAGLAPYRVR